VSDIETAVVDSLKVLDPERPIREADIARTYRYVRFSNDCKTDMSTASVNGWKEFRTERVRPRCAND
jgi:hypothetical protein